MALNLLQTIAGMQPEDGSVNPYAQRADIPAWLSQPQDIVQSAPQSNVLQQVQAATVPLKHISAQSPRASILDKIGRVADVLATVGGAKPLYEPTINAAQDRQLALANNAQQYKLNDTRLQDAQAKFATGTLSREAQGARYLQAIKQGGGDVSKAWPFIAARLGLSAEDTQNVGQALATDPDNTIAGLLAATADPKSLIEHYGANMASFTDAQGKLHFVQPSLGSQPAREISVTGLTPTEGINYTNAGGYLLGTGDKTGAVKSNIPVTQSPDNAANNARAEAIAAAKAKGGAEQQNAAQNVVDLLGKVKDNINTLHNLGALYDPSASRVENAINYGLQTGTGQTLVGATGGSPAQDARYALSTNINQIVLNMKTALGAGAKQFDSDAEGKRAMESINNPHASYPVMLDALATLEKTYKRIAGQQQKAPATPAPSGPTVSNW